MMMNTSTSCLLSSIQLLRNIGLRPNSISHLDDLPLSLAISSIGNQLDSTLFHYNQRLEAFKTRFDSNDKDNKVEGKDEKFILYRPGIVGWGNRIQGLYVSLAISLITDRILLIDWNDPLPLHDLVKLNPSLLNFTHWKWLESKSKLSCNAWLYPEGYLEFSQHVLNQQSLQDQWQQWDIVIISLGEDWIIELITNPNLKSQVQSVFGSIHNILNHSNDTDNHLELISQFLAHRLTSFLIKGLSESTESLYKSVPPYESVSRVSDQITLLLGLQIRMGSPNTSFKVFVQEKELHQFWQVINLIQTQLKEKNQNQSKSIKINRIESKVAIFLATDSIQLRQITIDLFGANNVHATVGPIVHSGNEQLEDDKGQIRSRESLYYVVLDWWWLGQCDLILRSRDSSFGRTAAIRTLKTSIVIPSQDLAISIDGAS